MMNLFLVVICVVLIFSLQREKKRRVSEAESVEKAIRRAEINVQDEIRKAEFSLKKAQDELRWKELNLEATAKKKEEETKCRIEIACAILRAGLLSSLYVQSKMANSIEL